MPVSLLLAPRSPGSPDTPPARLLPPSLPLVHSERLHRFPHKVGPGRHLRESFTPAGPRQLASKPPGIQGPRPLPGCSPSPSSCTGGLNSRSEASSVSEICIAWNVKSDHLTQQHSECGNARVCTSVRTNYPSRDPQRIHQGFKGVHRRGFPLQKPAKCFLLHTEVMLPEGRDPGWVRGGAAPAESSHLFALSCCSPPSSRGTGANCVPEPTPSSSVSGST